MKNHRTVSHQQATLRRAGALAALALLTIVFSPRLATAQEQPGQDQDDPPGRVARLGYMEGAVSFEPAGESEWVQAVPNRPITTGDKLWADRDSRAEVQLGSASIDLAANTGFSFLNLDDRTVQIQLSAGTISVRVWGLDRDSAFEIDTPNQAFTVGEPGRYRVEASENGDYTVVTIRDGSGESTGNGQSYTLHAGQRFTFSGTTSLNAEVEQIGNPDDFDNWSYARERRYHDSPSARYCSREVVGFEDLDDNGDWRDAPEYGHVWFPRVAVGWAPYHEGHWAWIDPWGWTWVDDDRWGYAPFHYGRWISIGGRWGWVPGPVAERPIYAPALVVFVGGGGIAFGSNVAWFPLGPREVYVPSYRVSEAYVNRVNITNTTVNTTTVTNVYNTTIVKNNTTITNVTYVNRNVQGAVTAVPQQAFASAQPVARAAVAVNAQQLASVPVSARAAVPPAHQAVLGAHADTANHVAAPPQAIATRAVIAKAAPPPPVPSFAARQQQLTQHPGQPVARQEMQKLAPSTATTAALVKRAPPAKPATPIPAGNANQPGNRPATAPASNERPAAPQPGNQPAPANRPEHNRPALPPPSNQPGNRPFEPPARSDRPPSAQPNPQPNRPQPIQPAPGNRPETSRPEPNRPEQPPLNNQPSNRPEPNRPAEPPARSDRLPSAQPSPQPNRPEPNQPAPGNRPEPNRPETNRPEPNRPATPPTNYQPNNHPEPNRAEPNRAEPNRPEPNRPETNRPPEPVRNQPAPREQNPPPAERQQAPVARPAPPPPKEQPSKPAPDEKKRQQEEQQRKKNDEKPKPPQ